jgi:hypothetical protein
MKHSKILLVLFSVIALFFMVSCEGLPTDLTGIESSDLETISDLLTTQTSEQGTQIITTSPQTSTDQVTSDLETTTEPAPTTTVDQTTTELPTTTEGPTTELPTHRIYFLNSQGWENVYAFAWMGESEYLGSLPGLLATQEADTNWWYVDVQINLEINELGMIFNNGDMDNLLQTPDVLIDSPFHLYVTITGESFVTKALAEDSIVSNRVWFYNSDEWSEVNAYAWVGSSRIFGNFPGQEATQEGETDWWYVDLPFDFSEIPVYIVFSGIGDIKTADLLIEDNINVYVSVDSKIFDSKEALENSLTQTKVWFYNSEGWDEVYIKGRILMEVVDDESIYDPIPNTLANQEGDSNWWFYDLPVDAGVYITDVIFNNGDALEAPSTLIDTSTDAFVTIDGQVFSSKELAIDSLDLPSTTVYYYNSEEWVNINAYVFGDSGEVLGPWQGSPATEDSENPGWWMIEVPLDASVNPFKIIFNNENGTLQSGEALIDDLEGIYVSLSGGPYTSRQLAIDSLSVSSTLYFYNSQGWNEVYAYMFGATGQLLGGWGGTLATQDTEDLDWWMIDIPVDVSNANFTIVFHDNQGNQTSDIVMESQTNHYITMNGDLFASKADAEASIVPVETTTIYFYNSNGWNEVYAFAYIEEGTPITLNWPGNMASQEAETDWWMVEIPVDLETDDLTIIFNNNNNGLQTSNILIETSTDIYTTVNGESFGTKADAEASIVPVETTTIYFYNSNGWNEVYAFAYIEEGMPITLNWPGNMASQEAETDWWMVEIPVDLETDDLTIIFNNNNNGLQTSNILIETSTDIYTTVLGESFSNKKDAENSIIPIDTTTIYFYNSDGWNEVYAFAYIEAGTPITLNWPGNMASQEADTDWWSVEIPVDLETDDLTIIFNNNVNGLETDNILINTSTDVYTTVNGESFGTKADAEASIVPVETTTIYFFNSNGWNEVYAFAYIEAGTPITLNWPGNMASQEADTDWWMVEIPVDLETDDLTIIFNNNNNGLQTENILIETSTDVYTTVNGENFGTKADAEDSLIPNDITTIYFYNSDGWNTVNAYVFDDQGEVLGEWPGTGAVEDTDNPDWWMIDVPLDSSLTPFKVIFNNGIDGTQSGEAFIDDIDNIYVSWTGGNYATRQAVMDSLSITTTIYYFNNGEWDNVYAFVFNPSGLLLGEWPGTLMTEVVGDQGWWTIDVPTDLNHMPFSLVFSNNAGQQTDDIHLSSPSHVYITRDGDVFDSKVEAEASELSTRIWYYNSEGWTEVYAVSIDEFSHEVLPLTLITQDGDDPDWWFVDVPVITGETSINIQFMSESFQNSTLTTIDTYDDVFVSFDGDTESSKIDIEVLYANTTTRLWFYNSGGWNQVYAWVATTNEIITDEFPGTLINQEVETDWWYVDLPVDPTLTEIDVVFTNGEFLNSGISHIASTDNLYVSIAGNLYASKEDTVNSLLNTTTIYYYNSQGWTNVYAYVYNQSGTLLGNWPGQMAIQDAEDANWWVITLPVDTAINPVTLIFNNGEEDVLQSSEVLIDTSNNIYSTYIGNTYPSKADAEASVEPVETTTIYFYNSDGWNEIYAFAYIEAGTPITLNWPGNMASQDGDTDWWMVEIPVDLETDDLTIIFNNNNNGLQTSNILIETSTNVYTTVNGENFGTKADAEASLIPVETTTVYFYNSDGWLSINAYVFGDEGEVLGAWQGSPATEDIENTDWWMIDVPLDASLNPFNIIFSNGDGALQSGEALIDSLDTVYVTLTGLVYSSRQLAVDSLSASSTLYFYNSEGWTEVYAYVFGITGTLLGEWGGTLATQDTEDPDWWMIDVPADLDVSSIMIVFHNNQGQQTNDIYIDSTSSVYVTLEGNVFDNKADAETSMLVTTTLYFYNSDQWSNVFVYASDAMGNALLGDTPGLEATQDGTSDWYFIEVPVDLNQDAIQVVFSDNGLNTMDQVTIDDPSYVYVDVNGHVWERKSLAEMALSSGEITRIHFYNSLGWEEVYAYVADEILILPNWPGIKAKQNGSSDWWYIDLPNDTSLNSVDIDFNMGTADEVSGVATINSQDRVYVTITGFTYMSHEEAETAMDLSTRIYFYNSKGWASVSAYVYPQDYGTLLGGRPGIEAIQDTEDPDWWYVDVPIDPSIYPIKIDFANNDVNSITRSYAVTINSLEGVYVSYYGDVFTSRTAIENEINVTTRVYFYNSDGWDQVAAYAYLEPGELLSSTWPGDALTKENDTDDWWYIDIPYDAAKNSFTIIFNDNNNNFQTDNILIDSSTNVYTTVNSEKFGTKADAEASIVPVETTTIYFYNSNGWSEVYAFAYIEAGTPITLNWPGNMASQEADTDWWMVEIPVDLETDNLTIIFNNNNNGLQTSNILIETSTNVYTTVNGGKYGTKADAEASLVPVEPTTIYFYNHEAWTEPYAFFYDVSGNFYGSWPGTLMTQEADSDWWTIDVLVDPSTDPIWLVFSDNGFPQTQDILIDDAYHVYVVPSGSVFTDKASAEAALESTTRVYFYNPSDLNWDARAFFWGYSGTNTGLITDWPGNQLIQWYIDDDNDPQTADVATDWYYIDVSTTTSSFFMVLSDNGSPQTKDLLIYAYDEVFIELDMLDSEDGKYTVNMAFSFQNIVAATPIE